MQTKSARPFLAVLAIVGLIAAAFFLKKDFAGAAQTSIGDPSAPQRMLVLSKKGVDMVPEPYPDWFKRVGYKKMGFDNEAQMQTTLDIVSQGRQKEFTADQIATLHRLMQINDPERNNVKQIAISTMPELPSNLRKEFVPDVKALFIPGSPNQQVRTILLSWCEDDEDLVKSLEKDPNKDFGQFANTIVTAHDYPGKEM